MSIRAQAARTSRNTAGTQIRLAPGGLPPARLLAGDRVLGYGFAWARHLLIEKNRPADFRYRIRSLCGDLRMFRPRLLGRIDDGIRRPETDIESGGPL